MASQESAETIDQSKQNPHYQSFLSTNQEMTNNKNGLNDTDMEAIKDIPYTREINSEGIVIHNFGDLPPVAIPDDYKIDLRYSDMDDKNGKRSLENLDESDKFRAWNDNLGMSKITFEPGAFERMRDHFFAIATFVAQKLGINNTIDVAFFEFEDKDNKSKYDRIARALRVITGQTFLMPYKIDSKSGLVSSLDCGHGVVGVFRDYGNFGCDSLAPFLKIGSSSSKK